jgi:glycolate oxidase FAD binding subunit
VVRVSGLPARLAEVLGAARELGGAVVSRAALGLSWVRLPAEAAAVAELRARLAPFPCVVLDAPGAVRAALDPWGPVDDAQARLAARVKERFDPAGTCGAGVL